MTTPSKESHVATNAEDDDTNNVPPVHQPASDAEVTGPAEAKPNAPAEQKAPGIPIVGLVV
jgi:hypothetical protein